MEEIETYEEALGRIIKDLKNNRLNIIEDFYKFYLAVNVKDENLDKEWISKNLELVERFDGLKFVSYFRERVESKEILFIKQQELEIEKLKSEIAFLENKVKELSKW